MPSAFSRENSTQHSQNDSTSVNLRAILPSYEVIEAMGRRRYQHPKVFQTKNIDKTARRWYFRARIDALVRPGETDRVEDRIYIGNVSEMTRREAEKRRDVILAESINRPDVMLASQILFGDVLDRWLATSSVKETTFRGYTSVIEKHIRPRWGKVRMSDITPLAVEDWLTLKARQCAKSTLNHIRFRFSQIWKRAIFWRFTREASPIDGMPPITHFGNAPRAKTLPTLEQFHHFLYLLDEPYRSIVIVCTLTGLRISEVMALTVFQLNQPSTAITEASDRSGKISTLKTKNSSREIPMAHLRADIVLPADAEPGDRPFNAGYFAVYGAIKEAAKLAGMNYSGFGLHTFRRMHNTLFRRHVGDETADLKLAQAQLGHADAKTNDLYYVPSGEDVARRMKVVSALRQKVMETVN